MNFEEWWENESGWGGDMLAEGQLAKEAWNAALSQARIECLANAARDDGSVGARNCIEIREALFDLHAT